MTKSIAARGLLARCTYLMRIARMLVGGVGVLAMVLAAFSGQSFAATTDWVGDAHAKARLVTAVEATGSGQHIDAGLEIRMAPGWHAYWRTPGDAGVSPTVEWKDSTNLASATIGWPAPARLIVSGLENYVYPDYVLLPISVMLTAPGKPLTLHASVDYAACAEVCIPYHADFTLALPSGLAIPGPEAPLVAAAWSRVPRSLENANFALVSASVVRNGEKDSILSLRLHSNGFGFRAPDLFVEGLRRGEASKPAVTVSNGSRTVSFDTPVTGATATELALAPLTFTLTDGPGRSAEFVVTPVVAGSHPIGSSALLPILGVALLGGLILNLMPCVLPVLSLKLLALAGLAGAARRDVRASLLATAAGVLASFLALAAVLIALKSAGAAVGWGIQFQQAWFVAAMAAVMTLFAASLWGWLPIDLPAGARSLAGWHARRPLIDAFATGAFATLLGASCSAPFVGTAIGFALARGPREILMIFMALGTGFAAPYLVGAAAPGLVRRLPRPGRWMLWLTRVLGLALLGTTIWLLVVLAEVASLPAALVSGSLLAALLAVLAWRAPPVLPHGPRLALGTAAAVLAALAVISPLLAARVLRAGAAGELADARVHPLWQSFDESAIPRLVAQGKVVFVDVSAAWCLTCKVNELAVLDRSPVADRLHDTDVVAMRADWTRPDPAITDYLQSFGRFGVPLDVVYGPGIPYGEALPELLSASSVMRAFEHAAPSGNSGTGVVAVGRSTTPRRTE